MPANQVATALAAECFPCLLSLITAVFTLIDYITCVGAGLILYRMYSDIIYIKPALTPKLWSIHLKIAVR